jgi:hypothetical protein
MFVKYDCDVSVPEKYCVAISGSFKIVIQYVTPCGFGSGSVTLHGVDYSIIEPQ